MAKLSMKDRIDGNELDLSLNQLTEVPVSDLASATKATHIDLSCNKIKVLPNNFSTLTHLVKIDLSKNMLVELPHNFGNLVNLRHLDLYGNNIINLPVSFCRLKNLKWLDLKKNPLNPQLKAIAGDCLDQKQCQACAKNVVAFMQTIESELERQKQKRLKEERLKEAERQAREAEELEKQRRKKKEERERRKAEAKAKGMAKNLDDSHDTAAKTKDDSMEFKKQSSIQGSWWSPFFKISLSVVFALFASMICYAVMQDGGSKTMAEWTDVIQENLREFRDTVLIWWQAFACPYFLSMKESFVHWIDSKFS